MEAGFYFQNQAGERRYRRAAWLCLLASAHSDAAWEERELPAAFRPLQADGSICCHTGN